MIVLGEIAPWSTRWSDRPGLFLFDSLTREIDRQLAGDLSPLRRSPAIAGATADGPLRAHWYPRAAERLAAVSDVDAAWLTDHHRSPGAGDPRTRSRTRASHARPNAPDPGLVTFVGTLDHPPNTDAIQWLVDAIWPLVVAHATRMLGSGSSGRGDRAVNDRPHIGDRRTRSAARWSSTPRTYGPTTGNQVAMAPIRLGAGMRSKVIHALACGTAGRRHTHSDRRPRSRVGVIGDDRNDRRRTCPPGRTRPRRR